ncbi:chromatin assembly factor 1 subunit A-like [Centruroides sculpturatus]|uniref:chromatin assembly factor 1 subunit A-like n=1 Tax=Centruroides sculpturatus TaxID=218467 RepID=UPI000C6D469E|nr:chromatin assembly factor 1 subunit A-like [Centruroides sculpturatus]
MVEEMDSGNVSLKQTRLPFKMLDAKSDAHPIENVRKRKLSDCDDNNDVAKCKKGSETLSLSNFDKVEANVEIENRPNVTSSPKITKQTKRLSQNCTEAMTLSPLKRAEFLESSTCTSKTNKNIETFNDSGLDSSALVEENNKGEPSAINSFLDESYNDTARVDSSRNNSNVEFVGNSVSGGNASSTADSPTDESLNNNSPLIIDIGDGDDDDNSPGIKTANVNKMKLTKIQKEKIKRERQRIRLETKERKERERLEAKAKKERERNEKLKKKKEREEKERLERLKQKEERRQQKQLLLESKLLEKKKREEERQKKLEEKKRAEEEKQKKLEEKRKAEEMQKMLDEKRKAEEEKKKEREKAAFVSFFVKTEPTLLPMIDYQESLFLPFEITKHMKVAPPVPSIAFEKFNQENFESLVSAQNENVLYTNELKIGARKPYKFCKEFRSDVDEIDDDVIVIDSKECEMKKKLKPKLLQFCENVRPPYWGTWRKKSIKISARKPLQKDSNCFDYDIDSDEEWEEGGPGESLSGTEDEKESEDDYEVDNDFFVPHGYLSEDEDGDENLSLESKRALLKMREREFQDERNKKCSELKPEIIATFKGNGKIEWTAKLEDTLKLYSPVFLTSCPIMTTQISCKSSQDSRVDTANLSSSCLCELQKSSSKQFVPEEAMPHLIKLVHANTFGRQTVIKEFQKFWQQHCSDKSDAESSLQVSVPALSENIGQNANCPQPPNLKIGRISKRQVDVTLQKIAEWCKNLTLNKHCWWVHEEVLQQYNLTDLPVPNNWQYVTPPKELKRSSITNKDTPSIKKFAKIITLSN